METRKEEQEALQFEWQALHRMFNRIEKKICSYGIDTEEQEV